jgi:long-chain acyl-CoA synthetase
MDWPVHFYDGIRTGAVKGYSIQVYRDRAMNIGELFERVARLFPTHEAIREGDKSYTYEHLQGEKNRIASALSTKAEVRKGDRVAILTDNSPEYCITLLAAAGVGAVTVPLNARCTGDELAYMINDCSPRVLVLDPPYLDVIDCIRGKIPSVEHYVVNCGVAEKGYTPWTDFREIMPGSEVATDISQDDVALILYTSGTTGKPKGAMITHFNLCNNVINVSRTLGTRPRDRTLIAVPLFHITGTMFQFLHMISVGGCSVLLRSFKTQRVLELLEREHISFFIGVPTIYLLMLMNKLMEQIDLSSLRIAAYGGAPMSEHSISQLLARLPNLHLHNTYGATETTGSCTMMPYQETIGRASSVGLPFMVNEVTPVDDTGRPLPPGEVGELWIRGPNVAKGYWNMPEATAKEFRNGFWRSGDLGKVDQEGFVYLMDRKKDMINRGGEKIFSVEVENTIQGHPKVQEVSVVGIPDEVFGEQVKAVIVPVPGARLSAGEIQTFVASRLSDYKVPKVVTFVNELPRNPGGKVIKALLKDLHRIED